MAWEGKQKICVKCKESKPIRNFAIRVKKSKTGKTLYASYCKICNAAANKKKQCPFCEKMISKTAKACASCAASNRKQEYKNILKNKNNFKGAVNPKWLVRGNVSIGGTTGLTQFNQ